MKFRTNVLIKKGSSEILPFVVIDYFPNKPRKGFRIEIKSLRI